MILHHSVQNVIDKFCKTDTTLSSLTAKNCMFRINRDVRFAKDKSPYKTNMGAYFNAAGKKQYDCRLLLAYFTRTKVLLAVECINQMQDALKKLRQEIDYNFNEFNKHY